ncbi:helix-turn-helix domain-containing protein [Saccharopolyspora sp. NPDC050642]|uniref:IclR family transcriptional regulator n=1 Tax=Saccharopolyspora sp. NPDC050642 TaxID=3157099 RepID=UPI0033F82862
MLEKSELSKTLDRGLSLLELLGDAGLPLTLTEVAERADLHRTIVHRLLRTLEAHGLVARDKHLRWAPGIGLVRLAATVQQDLRVVAQPVMEALTDEIGASVNLAVVDGSDIVVLAAMSPQLSDAHISYRVGQRHPLSRGAAGLAVLAAGPPLDAERAEVGRARTAGYAVTKGEIAPGTVGISSAVCAHGAPVASLGVSLFDDSGRAEKEIERVGARVAAAAATVSARLP